MSYSLNSLNGYSMGEYIGDHYYRGYSGGILGVQTIAHILYATEEGLSH